MKPSIRVAWLLVLAIAIGGDTASAETPAELTFRQPQTVDPSPPMPLDQRGAPAVLNLEDLQRIALRYNPTLAQSSMAVRAAQGGYVQAGLRRNPVIGYSAEDVGIDGSAGQQGMVVRQEILTGGKRRLSRNVAGHEVHEARWTWTVQQRRVLGDVRAGYYEVLLAQRMIDVNQQLVRVGEESAKTTQLLKDAADVSQSDVLQARIEAEVASLSLHEARNHHQAAWRRLVGLLGRPAMEPAALAGDVDGTLPRLEWETTLGNLWSQSPELARAHSGVQRAQCELARQHAQRVPNIEVELGAKYDSATEETLADVGVGLPLPLFNRNQGNITKARAQLIAAKNEVRRVELELRDRLVAAFEQYANARRKVTTYQESILPKARKSRDMIEAGYRGGEFGYLILLNVQRTYFRVNLDYLESLRKLWASSVRIDSMVLSGGLQEIRR